MDERARFEALSTAVVPHRDRLDHFGRNAAGYDLGGADGEGEDDCDTVFKSFDECDFGDGAPGETLFREALVGWARCWQAFDVRTAAVVFHADEGLIAPLQIDLEDWRFRKCEEPAFGNLVQLVSSARCYSRPLPIDEMMIAGVTTTATEFISPTVAEVAALLNVSEARVSEAVENHYWMFLGAQRDGSPEIEHEGE